MENNDNKDVKVGEFLVHNGIITERQLKDSLLLQRDNPERLIGEILVTQGILTKEELIMALELFLMVSDTQVMHVDEWLDQDEVDMIMEKIKEQQ